MIYIVCALSSEARVFIEHYGLKLSNTLPYPFFVGEEAMLIVSGIGRESAMVATAALLGYSRVSSNDLLLSVGICAAPKSYAIGSVLVANRLLYEDRSRYPDILFRHSVQEVSLRTVDEPCSSDRSTAIDMESFGIYCAAARFLSANQLLFVKIVSDHFEPNSINKIVCEELMRSSAKMVFETVQSALSMVRSDFVFDEDEMRRLERLRSFFTKSQYDLLRDASSYFKLKNKKNLPDNIELPTTKMHKKEKKELLERFLNQLTS